MQIPLVGKNLHVTQNKKPAEGKLTRESQVVGLRGRGGAGGSTAARPRAHPQRVANGRNKQQGQGTKTNNKNGNSGVEEGGGGDVNQGERHSRRVGSGRRKGATLQNRLQARTLGGGLGRKLVPHQGLCQTQVGGRGTQERLECRGSRGSLGFRARRPSHQRRVNQRELRKAGRSGSCSRSSQAFGRQDTV